MSRTSLSIALAVFVALATGCAKKPVVRTTSETTPTSARMNGNVRVDDELARRCNLHLGNVEEAPKFDFDEAALLPQDRNVLAQIAKCVTTGPLKGRKLSLVGRADPRGETEYNMVLGEHRAGAVHDYLSMLGVSQKRLAKTSRGELDAEGGDEDGWRTDRRVDVLLQH
jgi:peptidoglycan-associated lipoprotein